MLDCLGRWLCLVLLGGVSFSTFATEAVMDGRMQTWCFGRYLVDMPLEIVFLGGSNEYLGTTIETEQMTKAAFRERVDRRIAIAKAGGDDDEKGSKWDDRVLEKIIAIGEDGALLTSFIDFSHGRTYFIESFKFDRDWVFMASKALYTPNTNIAIRDFTKFVQTVRYRPEHEIPKEAGVCLMNGFIANGERMPGTEEADLAFRLKHNPDVFIIIKSRLIWREDPSLLERERASLAGSLFRTLVGKVRRVRSGKRTINGMPGEESLVTYPSDDGTGIAHAFAWETGGELNNPDKPKIRLRLNSGHKGSGNTGVSSMETAELLKLFDVIVKTIRLRPTGDAAEPFANTGE